MPRFEKVVGQHARLGASFSSIAAVAAAWVLTACGGSAMSVEQAGTELAGVYRLQTHTRNDAGCDVGGDSALDAESNGYLALYPFEAMGQQVLQATACASLEDCQDKAELARAMGAYWAAFELAFSGSDAGGLVGEEISTGSASMEAEDPCYGTVSEHRLQVTDGGIRIEQRSTVVDEFPKDDRFCTNDAARAAARDATCSRLTVITAVREGDLGIGSTR